MRDNRKRAYPLDAHNESGDEESFFAARVFVTSILTRGQYRQEATQ